MQTVTDAIESIAGSTGALKGLIEGVTEASRQQSHGIDQVSQATAQMEKVTQAPPQPLKRARRPAKS